LTVSPDQEYVTAVIPRSRPAPPHEVCTGTDITVDGVFADATRSSFSGSGGLRSAPFWMVHEEELKYPFTDTVNPEVSTDALDCKKHPGGVILATARFTGLDSAAQDTVVPVPVSLASFTACRVRVTGRKITVVTWPDVVGALRLLDPAQMNFVGVHVVFFLKERTTF